MKFLNWTPYGKEEPQVSEYATKMFRVERDHIYFSHSMKFTMNVDNFLVCCNNANDLPTQPVTGTDETEVGTDGDHRVMMSRFDTSPTTVQISLRGDNGWYSWIRFTESELESILETIMVNEGLDNKTPEVTK